MNAHVVRSVIIVVSSLFFTTIANAQSTIAVRDSVGLRAYSIVKGESATLFYDTAYILNKRLYKLYKATYNRAGKGNLAWQQLSETYADLVQRQDSLINTKEYYYTLLKQNFDSLAVNTDNFLSREEKRLNEISDNIKTASSNLNNIKVSIDESLEKLKVQRRQKTRLVAGGFVLGGIVTSLVFLVAE